MAFLGTKFKTLDIRDIKEKVEYPGIPAFETMFVLQKLLIDQYIVIEGTPSYPIDLHTKAAQILIKDFTGRIIEEFGEGFESYLIMLDLFHSGVEEEQMIPHLQNFNEEVADAIHFWLELMIYSGYDINNLNKWLAKLYENCKGTDPLNEWLRIAGYMVNTDLYMKKIPCRWVIKDHLLEDEFLRGGRQLGNERKNIMKQYLWDITYWLQIARNTLKNKPWKQTEMMTDLNQYEEAVSMSCLALFKFFYFAGFTAESLYVIYFKKNKINQFRIQSKY